MHTHLIIDGVPITDEAEESASTQVRRTVRGPVSAATDAPTDADDLVIYDTTANPVAVTLPTPAGRVGKSLTLYWKAGGNSLTTSSASGQVLRGSSYVHVALGQSITVVSDGTDWIAG